MSSNKKDEYVTPMVLLDLPIEKVNELIDKHREELGNRYIGLRLYDYLREEAPEILEEYYQFARDRAATSHDFMYEHGPMLHVVTAFLNSLYQIIKRRESWIIERL